MRATTHARLKSIRQIQRDKSTGDMSALPFVSLLANCSVWTLYGVLVGDPTVFVPNASGLLLGAYYTRVFLQYAATPPVAILGAGAAVIAASAGLALTQPVAAAAPYIGYLGCTLAVVLMASPLATMATVVREKSTASMSFIMSVVRSAAITICIPQMH